MEVVSDDFCQLRGPEILRFFKEYGEFNNIKDVGIISNWITNNLVGCVYKSSGVERYNIACELRNMYDGYNKN